MKAMQQQRAWMEERLMEQVSETSRRGLEEITESFRTFREAVRRHGTPPRHEVLMR